MSRRRPTRRRSGARPDVSRPGGTSETIEHGNDGDWVVRRLSGASSTKSYRCPGCHQTIRPATPHVVTWPVEGSTLSGGGADERRHWHSACWRARERRR